MLTLEYTPLRDGYTVQPSYPVIEQQFSSGGLINKRQTYLYSPHFLTLNWVLTTPTDYTRFMGFFRTSLNNGNDFFLMDLVTDIMLSTPHVCRLKGSLPQLNQKRGLSFYVSAMVEVRPNPTYTGMILYQEPGNVIFSTTSPSLVGPIVAGDTIQIINSAGSNENGVEIDLDGTYVVDSTVNDDTLVLTSPDSVNAQWSSVLATLGSPGEYGDADHGAITSTITRIPT